MSGIRVRFLGYAGGALVAVAAATTSGVAAEDFSGFRLSNSFEIVGEDVAEVTTRFAGEDGQGVDSVKTVFDYGAGTYCRNSVCAPFGVGVDMVGRSARFFAMIHEEACRQAALQTHAVWDLTLTDGDGHVLESNPADYVRARHGRAFFQKYCLSPVS